MMDGIGDETETAVRPEALGVHPETLARGIEAARLGWLALMLTPGMGRRSGFLTSRRMLRTSSMEAMVQLGTMERSGVRAAMGMRPRSAAPALSSAAQMEGEV